eukprot:TRINITY_DN28273_c0_g1_i1.p1 TRINITY_DN28273_c0_g1~~TRINITY_DN28273_c0_g1_i1.p1  ORF type:complete len:588 (+),score=106.90 TRINITY_DN28273_c0_g1_i1:128-1891(+)
MAAAETSQGELRKLCSTPPRVRSACAGKAGGLNISWGSSVSGIRTPPVKKFGPRVGEALDFGTPLRSGQSADVALAGLRLFITERFGGVKQAFERMDFHRDGRVSCLEFQEVISGQERYCGLQEARELFCLLARGTGGWLGWEAFQARLGGAQAADAESGGSWSCASSESASHALRALLVGSKAEGKRADCDGEADDVATTVQSLTSRSSLSAAPLAGRGACSAPSRPTAATGRCDVLLGQCNAQPLLGQGKAQHTEAEIKNNLVSEPSNSSLARRLLADAMQESRTRSGADRDHSQVQPSRLAFGESTSSGTSSALNRLEQGLSSLRGEVAALQAMGAAGRHALQDVGGGRPSLELVETAHNRVQRSDWQLQPQLHLGGLAWISKLPQRTQGRLAACTAPAEALELLEEALDSIVQEPSHCIQFGSCSREASPELVAAAMALLQQARDRLSELEALRNSRQQQHQEALHALRQRLHAERRKSQQRLLARLAPPGVALPSKGPPASPGLPSGSTSRSRSTGALHTHWQDRSVNFQPAPLLFEEFSECGVEARDEQHVRELDPELKTDGQLQPPLCSSAGDVQEESRA